MKLPRAAVALVLSLVAVAASPLELRAQADESQLPILRVRFDPEDRRVMATQPLRLYVDVFTPTWFPRAPQLPDLEIPQTVTVLPEERAAYLSETIDGRRYTGVSRSYLIYPQGAGQFTLPPAEVSVVYAVGGARSSEPLRLPLPQETFAAYVPPEAAGLDSFLATTNLNVEETYNPEPLDLREGDSFRRTVTISADGLFGMFLPPLEFEHPDGIAAYPEPSQVNDRRSGRGAFEGGERVESVTYVFQQAGSYQLPAIEISWWNLERGQLQTETLPALDLEVGAALVSEQPRFDLPPPEPEPTEAESEVEVAHPSRDFLALAAVAIVLLAGAAFRFGPSLKRWMAEREAARLESEGEYFRAFREACRKNDAQTARRRLAAWVRRADPHSDEKLLQEFAKTAPNVELHQELAALDRYLYAADAPQAAWEGNRLLHAATRARSAGWPLGREHDRALSGLPALNPRG